jgi:hypothetical protein
VSFDLGSYHSPTRLHRIVVSRVSLVCCDEVELNCGLRFLVWDISTPRLKFYTRNTGVNNHTSESSFSSLNMPVSQCLRRPADDKMGPFDITCSLSFYEVGTYG